MGCTLGLIAANRYSSEAHCWAGNCSATSGRYSRTSWSEKLRPPPNARTSAPNRPNPRPEKPVHCELASPGSELANLWFHGQGAPNRIRLRHTRLERAQRQRARQTPRHGGAGATRALPARRSGPAWPQSPASNIAGPPLALPSEAAHVGEGVGRRRRRHVGQRRPQVLEHAVPAEVALRLLRGVLGLT